MDAQIIPSIDVMLVAECPEAGEIAAITLDGMWRQASFQPEVLKKPFDELPLPVVHEVFEWIIPGTVYLSTQNLRNKEG